MPGTDAHTAVCDEHGQQCPDGDELSRVGGRVLCEPAASAETRYDNDAVFVAACLHDPSRSVAVKPALRAAMLGVERCVVTGYPEDECGGRCCDPGREL